MASRTSVALDREPGVVIYNGATIYSASGWTLEIPESSGEIASDVHGDAGDVLLDRVATLRGTPVGEWEHLSVLWPYGSTRPGQSMYGADKPLIIHTLSGRKFTFAAGCVLQPPPINCSPGSPLFGEMTFEMIGADDTAWTDTDSFYTEEAEAFASAAAFSEPAILRVPFGAAWGALSDPWDAIRTEAGFSIQPTIQSQVVPDDTLGTIDRTLMNQSVTVSCVPRNVTAAHILALVNRQGAGAKRGMKKNANAHNLVLTGDGGSPVITIVKAALMSEGFRFGAGNTRVGQLSWKAQRSFSSGVGQPLYTLA